MTNTTQNSFKSILKILIIFFICSSFSLTSVANNNKEFEFTVSRGDTFYKIFSQTGLDQAILHKMMKANNLANLLNYIHPGDKIKINIKNNNLRKIIFNPLSSTTLIINYNGDKFDFISIDTNQKKNKLQKSEITITKSLNHDGKKAGINKKTLDLIIDNFSWDINFNKDLQIGDKFILFWEQNKDLKAIIYKGKKKTISLFAYQTKENDKKFYTMDGKTTNDSFYFAPLEYVKISSGFSKSRYHPILKKYRSHRGTDFAAPENTPIYAPAKGVIKHIAVVSGYGNVIYMAHGEKIVTVYAHLSKFAKNLRTGQKINKGKLIGYVGSTGLATGPHLHYEIRINGEYKDPEKIILPKQSTITGNELLKFQKEARYILSQLKIK